MGMGVEEWVPPGFEPRPASVVATDTGEWAALEPGPDLNRATFEDLRALGLSVPEALRVLVARERGRRFDSHRELADLPGLGGGTVVAPRRAVAADLA